MVIIRSKTDSREDFDDEHWAKKDKLSKRETKILFQAQIIKHFPKHSEYCNKIFENNKIKRLYQSKQFGNRLTTI